MQPGHSCTYKPFVSHLSRVAELCLGYKYRYGLVGTTLDLAAGLPMGPCYGSRGRMQILGSGTSGGVRAVQPRHRIRYTSSELPLINQNLLCWLAVKELNLSCYDRGIYIHTKFKFLNSNPAYFDAAEGSDCLGGCPKPWKHDLLHSHLGGCQT